MARAFDVTVDFLIGEGENASYDKETVERINDIQKMYDGTKSGECGFYSSSLLLKPIGLRGLLFFLMNLFR